MTPPTTATTTVPRTTAPAEEMPASGPRTLGDMLLNATEHHTGIALEYQKGGHRVSIAYPDLGRIVTEIARGLIALGIQQGDRVAILGATSAEWTMADYGALCAGAVVTPIYHTNSAEECAYVLAHSGARLVFCEDSAQAAKVAAIRDRCPALKQVVLFDGAAEDALTLRRLRKHARDATVKSVHLRLQATNPDDVATLVYTSGTTGPPKGCMLTHANFLTATRMYVDQLGINETHSMYQFLPLAHVLARVAQAVVIRAGARVVLLERRRDEDHRRARRASRRPTSRPCRASTRRSTPRQWAAPPTGRPRSARCSAGRSRAAPRPGPRRGRAAGRRQWPGCSTPSPTGSCCRRSGACSDPSFSSRSSAPPPSPESCSSSSRRAGCSCSRDTA